MDPVTSLNSHGFLQGLQSSGGYCRQAGLDPGDGVLIGSVHGVGRQLSGEGVVNCCRHGVYIRPGAGATLLEVLLPGTEAAFGYLHGG